MNDFSAVLTRDPLKLQKPLAERHKRPELYRPAKGLREALDVAMLLGVPLLLTGAPGTGKTRAAYWLNATLRDDDLLRYDVKSVSTGADLLYNFDEVSRFRDAAPGAKEPLVKYLRLNALGEAIARAAGGGAPLRTPGGEPLVGEVLERHSDQLDKAFGESWRRRGRADVALLLPNDPAFQKAEPEHRIVLIDELDKAPRDTPNDLLAEVEEMRFLIPELGVSVAADPDFRPIVIITSNSEKSFPDPFLRRCAYFDIPLPSDEELRKIIAGSIERLSGGGSFLDQALDLFRHLREENGIRKAPGTAELLAWLDLLVHRNGCAADTSLRQRALEDEDRVADTLAAVLKTRDDREAARRVLARWRNQG
ncbi:MAG TPA: MoxR family ATPase [Allosphingosinicella sp.]|jgi:MoxR-like ATPase